MEPLDFTVRPPRTPYQMLDGLLMLPRTIDKFRATLGGGAVGGYRVAGMSKRLLDWMGVDEEAMREAVASAASDDDVAAWLRARVDTSQYPEYNRRMLERSIDDVADKEAFYETYPWARDRGGAVKLFDVMVEDDGRTFAPKTASG